MNKWISVKEKLPTFDEAILIFQDDNIYIGRLADSSLVEDEDFYHWLCSSGRLRNVTHWMEMPESPK